MRRFIAALFFLMLVDESSAFYHEKDRMFAPFAWVHAILFDPLPIKVRPFDLIMVVILVLASSRGATKSPRVRPMHYTLLLAAGTTVAWAALGLVRGGDARAASWQVYLMLAGIVTAFAIAATHKRAEHFATLGKVIVAAGIYRAAMCMIFYALYVRTLQIVPFPQYLTTHDDTVLWNVAIAILLVYAAENARAGAKAAAALAIPLMLAAIQYNNRRLAWVSLLGAVVTLFFLLRPSPAKRRVQRGAMILVPILALYVIIGLNSSSRIFKPVAAFTTITTQEDASSLARNVENLGLINTANQWGWLLGSGWGHRYSEVSNKYSIAEFFELWPYIPHNSILGLFAYTGCLGFAGYWMMVPTAMFLHARTARAGRTPVQRGVGIAGCMALVVCANQFYGDMGIFSSPTMYTLSLCFAAALRVPVEAGAWPQPGPATS